MSSPTLTVHHLRRSQSERIVWLCEELGIPYNLKCYDRRQTDMLAPDEYRSIHWSGTAPAIEDDISTSSGNNDNDNKVVLAESGAVVEYILAKYGNGRLQIIDKNHARYPDYLFWFHHANGSLQPDFMFLMLERFLKVPKDPDSGDSNPLGKIMAARLHATLKGMDHQLSKFDYLAGEQLTAADIMVVFSLTTMRAFVSFSLEEYPNIVDYLQRRIGRRDGYQRAMEKGDPGMVPALSANV